MQLPLEPQMSRSAAANTPHKRLELDPPGVGEQPNFALTSSTTQQAGLFSPGPLPWLPPEPWLIAIATSGNIAPMLITNRTNNVRLHMTASFEQVYDEYASNRFNRISPSDPVPGEGPCRRSASGMPDCGRKSSFSVTRRCR